MSLSQLEETQTARSQSAGGARIATDCWHPCSDIIVTKDTDLFHKNLHITTHRYINLANHWVAPVSRFLANEWVDVLISENLFLDHFQSDSSDSEDQARLLQ